MIRIFLLLLVALLAMPCPASAQDPGRVAPAVGQEVQDWRARLEMARLLGYSKRYDEALGEYRKVLVEQPDSREARIGMAQVLFWTGRNVEASEAIKGLDENGLTAEERLLWADLAVTRKDWAGAGRLYRAYLIEHPGDQAVRFRLAEVLSWDGRFKDSIKEYESLLAAAPGDRHIRRKYAQVLEWAGRRDDAIREYQKSLAD